jgi:glycosyl hydrolase family 99
VRRLLPTAVALLVLYLPAAGEARPPPPPGAAIFYYPWYGTPARDGGYQHWAQNAHRPPADVASDFYPARGAYSSSDPAVIAGQMREIASAGIREVVVSWWGIGSPEDERLTPVLRAATANFLEVAAHLEPYRGRTVASTAADIAYLRARGVRDFFVYRAGDFPAAQWATLRPKLGGARLFAHTTLVGFAKQGGFAGVYTYDILTSGGDKFARLCTQAHRQGLLCLPSVGPGYSARRATSDTRVKRRRDGSTYDAMWTAALRARADIVTITSYNEWHEGTQIEPARAKPGYLSYEGAWGLHGPKASKAYLTRTARWTSRLRAGR